MDGASAAPPSAADNNEGSALTQGLLAVGVLACFIVSSVTQESLTRTRDDGTRFGSGLAFQRLHRKAEARASEGGAPVRSWVIVVLSYFASHWCGLASLRHLSYPVHVTFKSCKAIPVVIGERLLTEKRHSLSKKLGVLVMCLGVTIFLLGGEKEKKSKGGATTVLGVGLIVAALFFDGIYAGMQQQLVARSSEFELMLHMNGWQGVLAAVACVSSGELATATAYAATHKGVYGELACYTLSKAVGTLCIYRLLRESGTLVVATVTTLRKVLSVLISVVTFGHSLSVAQLVALLSIFTHKYIGDAIAKPLSRSAATEDAKKVA